MSDEVLITKALDEHLGIDQEVTCIDQADASGFTSKKVESEKIKKLGVNVLK
jgi:hypothetical protein